jgi:pyruvate formate lyase activating enzyme
LEELKGLITDVKPFAVHNGPGLRTVIYMKGCPLRCSWCASPQMQSRRPEILYEPDRCLNCDNCIQVCPQKALSPDEKGKIIIDRQNCNGCGLCVESCRPGALEISGRYYNLSDLMNEVEKDIPLYNQSKGGVTISGGEPFEQAGFVADFLRQCRNRSIHTALETCGFTPWTTLASFLEVLDLIYFDLKHMDPKRHQEITGVSNQKILENIQKAALLHSIIIRLPLIPGMNDTANNLAEVVRFAKGLGNRLLRLELIPFHKHGKELYRQLDRVYHYCPVAHSNQKIMEKWKNSLVSHGLIAQIGG